MANMKFKVKDASHSLQIQHALYAAGYAWSRSEIGDHTGGAYLYANGDTMKITRGDLESVFKTHMFEEHELFTTFKKVDRPFNINGKLMTLQEAKDYIKAFEGH